MTRKLTNKKIVGEAMYSVRRSLDANIPPPPTNADGSYKTLDQMVNETKMNKWITQKEDQRKIADADAQTANDPEQLQWEREQRQAGRGVEYEIVVPDGVKAVMYALLFVGVCGFLALFGQ